MTVIITLLKDGTVIGKETKKVTEKQVYDQPKQQKRWTKKVNRTKRSRTSNINKY